MDEIVLRVWRRSDGRLEAALTTPTAGIKARYQSREPACDPATERPELEQHAVYLALPKGASHHIAVPNSGARLQKVTNFTEEEKTGDAVVECVDNYGTAAEEQTADLRMALAAELMRGALVPVEKIEDRSGGGFSLAADATPIAHD